MPANSPLFGLLGLLDWVVVVTYAGGLILLGLLMSRRRIAPVDYFLASRASNWPVIGLALLASNMSSTALVGLAIGSLTATPEIAAMLTAVQFTAGDLKAVVDYAKQSLGVQRYRLALSVGYCAFSVQSMITGKSPVSKNMQSKLREFFDVA